MAGDYGGMPTRYGQMFGTPNRAAQTIHEMCRAGVLICERGKRSGGGRCPLKPLCDGLGRLEPSAEDAADWLHGGYDDKKVRASLGY